MFNLEQSITDWRKQMLAAGLKTPAPLEELESHLREEVAAQMRLGLDTPAAFEAAVHRIGPAETLQKEFSKTVAARKARERRRNKLICAGIYGFGGLALACRLSSAELSFNERLSGLAAVATMLLGIYFVLQILPRFLPVVQSKILQSAIGMTGGISGVVWMMAFAWLILPHCDFTPGQLLVAVCWAAVPMMLLPAIGFMFIDKSECQQIA